MSSHCYTKNENKKNKKKKNKHKKTNLTVGSVANGVSYASNKPGLASIPPLLHPHPTPHPNKE